MREKPRSKRAKKRVNWRAFFVAFADRGRAKQKKSWRIVTLVSFSSFRSFMRLLWVCVVTGWDFQPCRWRLPKIDEVSSQRIHKEFLKDPQKTPKKKDTKIKSRWKFLFRACPKCDCEPAHAPCRAAAGLQFSSLWYHWLLKGKPVQARNGNRAQAQHYTEPVTGFILRPLTARFGIIFVFFSACEIENLLLFAVRKFSNLIRKLASDIAVLACFRIFRCSVYFLVGSRCIRFVIVSWRAMIISSCRKFAPSTNNF